MKQTAAILANLYGIQNVGVVYGGEKSITQKIVVACVDSLPLFEKKTYDFSNEIPSIHDLSIGKTLVILCNDAFELKFGKIKYAKQLWGDQNVDLIVVISYWENGIDEFLVGRGVKRLAKAVQCEKWILRDHFNGFRDSGNIDFSFE